MRIKGSTIYRTCEGCNKCDTGSDTYEREQHGCAKECLCDYCRLEIGFNESSLSKDIVPIAEEKALYNNRRLFDRWLAPVLPPTGPNGFWMTEMKSRMKQEQG